jgi:DNA-binding XRE family transcriptional regulator
VFHQEEKNTLIDIEITYRPGKWFEKFAGHEYLREFGYITSEALKLDSYQEKMALRLAYFALFALQQHKSGRYQIETLLTRIGYKNDIETAKRNGVTASNLKRSFDRGLKTLGNFEYPYLFDYEPDVPDWAHPNSQVKKPNHWFETWLQLNGTLRQPEALPKHPLEPKPEQPQPPKRPARKRKSVQPAANLTEPIAFGQWVREARKALGESLRTMAKELEISASLLSQIENGCYRHTIKPSLKTQIIRHLGLND